MSDIEWTSSQKEAIHTFDRSLLVSAGAGSGKTAVLAERCAKLVLDADPPCEIDQLLVVTFTEAAAAEMRERIGRSLRKRQAANPSDSRLKRQLFFLDTAQISTIHSFCRTILNRYFAQADIDPQSPILDPNEAAIMKREAVRGVFDSSAARRDAGGAQFLEFLAAYGSSEKYLQDIVLRLCEFLASLPDPEAWLDTSYLRLMHANKCEPSEFWLDSLGILLIEECAARKEMVIHERARLMAFCPDVDEARQALRPFLESLDQIESSLEGWRSSLERDRSAATINEVCLKGIAGFQFPALPRRRASANADELLSVSATVVNQGRSALEKIRDSFQKDLQERWSRFDVAGWTAGLDQTLPHMLQLLGVVRATRDAYQNAKRELGVIDFSDLERMTYDLLLDESNGVAARLRDEIRHVLVDEYQDVSPIQAEILRLVSRDDDPNREGNLFTVGDVKQSIYRFRLAEPALFLARQRRFMENPTDKKLSETSPGQAPSKPPGRAIDLVSNFRSDSKIIDAINAVFEKLMAADLGGINYDRHARLVYGPKADDSSSATPMASGAPPIELHILETFKRAAAAKASDDNGDMDRIELEAYAIAERIKALVAEGRQYGEIAILMRSMKPRAEIVARTLNLLGVPVHVQTAGGLFDTLESRDILSLLAVLDNARQDIPLAAVLASPLLGDPLDATTLAGVRASLGPDGRSLPFHVAASTLAAGNDSSEIATALRSRFRILNDWRRRIHRRPVAEVLWEIYEESGYLAYVCGLRDGEQRYANLVALHEQARRFGEFQRQGLNRFLQFIDAMQDSDQDLDAGAVSVPTGNVVKIMSIHRSKGLEFPIVILAEIGKKFNTQDASGPILYDRRLGIAMKAVDAEKRIIYPTLSHNLVRQANLTEMLAEELRVLYVGLTRAKHRLILVGTGQAHMLLGVEKFEAGPLSILTRRSATSFLDWVVSAIGAQPRKLITTLDSRPVIGPLFATQCYTLDQMSSWTIEPKPPTKVIERLRAAAATLPLDAPTPSAVRPAAAKSTGDAFNPISMIERRLTVPYPAEALTHVPGVVAASILKRTWNTISDDDQPVGAMPAGRSPGMRAANISPADFRLPAFATSETAPAGPRLGTLTHEFLQQIDLTRPCDEQDLKAQLAEFTSLGCIGASEAAAIDIEALAWFFQTEPGKLLRKPGTRVLREQPFVLSVDPTKYDPRAVAGSPDDIMLVRGIIDCLFDAGDGWEVVDYKTDRVSGPAVDERAAIYDGQLKIYAAAIEALWRSRPCRSWLAFLHPRRMVRVG
ncbi:MAG: helicase-exonuclease AddAB subunit AddA [Phycisphaerae bacterium]|nr:helicase-exonuclease AddAB subunit AddA [Phycisphaerae bacterium]